MARGLTIAAMVIAVLMLVLFALDLAIGLLGENMIIDIAFLVCGVGMILLGISTWRELE